MPWTETSAILVLRQEFAPSDEELEAYRKGEKWDPKVAEQRRRLKVKLCLCIKSTPLYFVLI